MILDHITYFFRMLRSSAMCASPFITRVLLMLALFLMGICIATNDNWDELRTLEWHRTVAPQWAWASAYILAGLLKLWRLTDKNARTVPGILINGFACFLFTSSSAFLWASGSPMGALGMFAAVNAFWMTVRTTATTIEKRQT